MKIQALIAALALAPALSHAQAISPAQPRLEARLTSPQPLNAAAPDRSTGNTTSLRVSTGVVPPRLVHSVDVESSMDWQWAESGPERVAEVSMIVDQKGRPTNLKIVKSAGMDIDQNLLESVSRYRFEPATVSHQATPMEVDLQVHVLKPSF
ncbi:MAG TPA: TonB family protein [Granulicella sp.]|nr:TonB family protein [Granulicella sp.]